MRRLWLILFTIHCSLFTVSAQEVLSLSGSWDLSLGDSLHYDDYVVLPGSLLTNGKGDKVTVAWYRRSVYVPASWERKHVTLFLERPHIETTIFVNGQKLLHQDSPSTPHVCDVSQFIRPGQRNEIVVCVYSGNWNGITGCLELRAQPRDLFIKQLRLRPNPAERVMEVEVEIGGSSMARRYETMELMVQEDRDSANLYISQVDVTGPLMKVKLSLGDQAKLWDEFFPQLYRLGICLGDDYYETTFGLREVAVEGRQLMINGRPLYLRGTVENCCFPETGYPPTDEASWMRIFRKCKDYGLNHVRFHSYCPPEAAFAAADRVGIYLQPEDPSGPDESKRIVDAYGHHPSFMMMAADNEPACELPQYTGAYKARSFEMFRDLLCDPEMASQAEHFLMASGRLQTLYYKNEIERNLCTPDYAGFQLLGLNDYTDADTWRQFCSPLVPLARFPRFVYTNADTLTVPVEVYNAMYGDLKPLRVNYYISGDSGRVITGGQLSVAAIPMGKNTQLGTVRVPLHDIQTPQKLTLNVTLGTSVRNQWDFWVYPSNQDSANRGNHNYQLSIINCQLFISDTLDNQALSILSRGGTVLLTVAGKMRPPHTTGAYIQKEHPLFKHGFPTDDWSNLNWWELLNKAQVMDLQDFPADYQPPVQPIDTCHVSRKLGMLVEARVLKGKLLMTTMDITSDLDRRIVARQMRQAILSYMQSPDFQPALTLQPEVIQNLFTKEAPKVDMFTRDSPDELKPKIADPPQSSALDWDGAVFADLIAMLIHNNLF